MPVDQVRIVGLPVPSNSPFFLGVVGLHVLVALTCIATGLVAMLSQKRPGRHPVFGTVYYWSLSAVFGTATILSALRWAEDWYLFILGALAFLAAF